MSHSDDEEINDEDDQLPQLDTADADGSITSVPTLRYYQKRYAGTLSDNDQKAVRLFKEYENLEMVRRLQSELLWVANGQVYEQALDSNIGKKRKGRYKTYAEWRS